MKAVIEDGFLQEVAGTIGAEGIIRLRCTVPENAAAAGGLTVYGESSGRYPIAPTLAIEWPQGAPSPAG
jgi:predicted transcriptional regulator